MILFYQPLNSQICPPWQLLRREQAVVATSGSPKDEATVCIPGAER